MTDISEVRTALELFAASKDCPAADEQRIRAILDHHARLQAKLGKLQAMQARMRDPERQMVCDIIANGLDRETAGVGRYEVPDAQPAPAIDLGQFRNAVEAEYQIVCASHNTGLTHTSVLIAAVKKRQSLLALIDGQAKTSNAEIIDRATHRVYRAGGEWLPCHCRSDADHLIGDEQPAKGEGVADD